MPPPMYMPPTESTLSARLPASAPYAETNMSSVSRANLAFPGQTLLRDDSVQIFGCRDCFFGQLRLDHHPAHVAQELEDIGHPHAADHALPTDAALVLLLEETEQLDLFLVARTVIRVSALGRIGNMDAPVPGQQSFTQPRSSRDQGLVSDLAGVALGQGVNLVGWSSAMP